MITLKKENLFSVFMLLLIFMPTLVSRNIALSNITAIVVNLLCLLNLLLWSLRKLRCSSNLKKMSLYFLIILISTFLNHGKVLSTFLSYSKIFIFCYIVEYIIKKNDLEGIVMIKKVLSFYVILNFLSLIIFPNEYYQYSVPWWLFGNKNSMFMWLFLANVLTQICLYFNEEKEKKYLDYIMILVTLFSAFLSKSSTTIISISLLSLFPLIKGLIINLNDFFNLKTYFVFFIFITLILLSMTNLGIIDAIAHLFGKNSTFTGRTDAWKVALKAIKKSLLYGYGYIDADQSRNLLHGFAFVNTHNAVLQIGIEGGILLYSAIVGVFINIYKNIKNIKNLVLKSFISWIFIPLFIEMSFEALVDSAFFWIILIIIFKVSKLAQKVG